MSFAMGICIALAIFTGIFAYFTSKEEEMSFKWFYLCFTFLLTYFSLNIMSRLATDASYTEIAGILDGMTVSVMYITLFLFFVFFILVIKNSLELFNRAKDKSFNEE